MANQVINKQAINVIRTLWVHHIPQKLIAEALDIKYATVSMYCRSFKAVYGKLEAKELVASILEPNSSWNCDDIIDFHLARG